MPRSKPRLTRHVLFSAFVAAALAAARAEDVQHARVRSIADGDTIRVDLAGRTTTVRLIGIDTPELGDRNDPTVGPQPFAREATDFTRRALNGQRVRLEFEPTERVDKYGRTLAYVFLDDGTFLNRELLRSGLAHLYTHSAFRHQKRFRADEEEARRARRGLWSLAAAPPTGPVIGNRVSGIYHLPGQRHYRRVAERNRVYFDSEAAARAAGFQPARR
jgi:micrococcal nuclease